MRFSRIPWEYLLLGAILVGLFWLRMELATSVPTLEYGSYSVVRGVEHIQQTGLSLTQDPLSVTGHQRVGSPLFAYLLAGLTAITPAMYKVVPNLFMVLLLIPVYAITRRITQSTAWSFVAVVLAATGPFVFAAHLTEPSAAPFALFIFMTILSLLHDPDRWLSWLVSLTILLTFVHPLSFLLALALLTTLALLRLEGFGIDRRIGELLLFTLVLAAWFTVLVYKQALFADGIRIIWQNLPVTYASTAFGSVTFLSLIYGLGVIAFLFGILGSYHALFELRIRPAIIVLGALGATIVALLARVVELRLGLLLLTLLLAIMAVHGLRVSAQYASRMKATWLRYGFALFVLLLFLYTAIFPSLGNARVILEDSPSLEELAAYKAAADVIPSDAVVLTTLHEASAFQYAAGRTTLADNDFILVPNGDELSQDIDEVYTTRFTTGLLSKAAKLGFTHVLFSPDAQRIYGREAIAIEPNACVRIIPIAPGTLVYEITCRGEMG
jgi:hypothetical protein